MSKIHCNSTVMWLRETDLSLPVNRSKTFTVTRGIKQVKPGASGSKITL